MADSTALARLRRKRQDLQERYRTSTAASLNKYGKTVQQAFDDGLVSRANLINQRRDRETAQQSLREQFTLATSNVLSQDTLDILKSLSDIQAPTLTSIFLGYESARADRANRFEKLLDQRQEAVVRLEETDLAAFKAGESQRTENLSQRADILQTGQAASQVVFKSQSEGISTAEVFVKVETLIQAKVEEADRLRTAAAALLEQRAALQAAASSVNNDRAIAKLNLEIAAKQASAEAARVAAANLQTQRDTAAQQRQQSTQTFQAAQTTSDQTFTTTRDATNAANTLEQINARGENAVTLATTVRPQAPSGPTNEETAARLRLLSGGYTVTPPTTPPTTATADDAPTSPAVTTPTTTTPTTATTTAAEPTTVREVSADGTTSTVELENVGTVVPTIDPGEEAGPAIIPEPTAAAAGTTDFFAQTTADGGDPLATLAELVTQARPDAAANLGDTPTVDQLAGVIDSELELQDERIGQLLNGIRTLETDEVEIV